MSTVPRREPRVSPPRAPSGARRRPPRKATKKIPRPATIQKARITQMYIAAGPYKPRRLMVDCELPPIAEPPIVRLALGRRARACWGDVVVGWGRPAVRAPADRAAGRRSAAKGMLVARSSRRAAAAVRGAWSESAEIRDRPSKSQPPPLREAHDRRRDSAEIAAARGR